MKRVYTILDFPKEKQTYGKFMGESPQQAAKKAFSKLARLSKLNNKNRQFIVFVMKEIETNKEYKYIGSRVKLIKPRVVYHNGNKVVYHYINVVGKYKEELNKIR